MLNQAMRAILALCFFAAPLAAQQAPGAEQATNYKNHRLVRVSTKTNGDVLALSSIGTIVDCRPRVGSVHVIL